MNWDVDKSKIRKKVTVLLDAEEQTIYDLLTQKQHQIDELSYKSQIPIGKLPAVLLNLEIKGIVKALPGQKYSLL
jgi:DNA processing protein